MIVVVGFEGWVVGFVVEWYFVCVVDEVDYYFFVGWVVLVYCFVGGDVGVLIFDDFFVFFGVVVLYGYFDVCVGWDLFGFVVEVV